MIDIGYFSLCVALAFSGWAMVAPLVGVRRGHEALIRRGEDCSSGLRGGFLALLLLGRGL